MEIYYIVFKKFNQCLKCKHKKPTQKTNIYEWYIKNIFKKIYEKIYKKNIENLRNEKWKNTQNSWAIVKYCTTIFCVFSTRVCITIQVLGTRISGPIASRQLIYEKSINLCALLNQRRQTCLIDSRLPLPRLIFRPRCRRYWAGRAILSGVMQCYMESSGSRNFLGTKYR